VTSESGAYNLVAIETATETVGVAVRSREGVKAEFALTGRRRHVETLVPVLEHLLGQIGLDPSELDAIAVDLGPGLFTGLRVGVATAKGLAQSLGLGVIGLTSLEVLLEGAARTGLTGFVLAAVDARRGEVFATLATIDAGGSVSPLGAPHLAAPDEVATVLASLGSPAVAVGDGARRYADMLEATPGVHCLRGTLAWPPPAVLLELAAGRLDQGETPVAPDLVVPLYMREADAKSNFTQVNPA
jgi:tRNA threonylcarbamoyladenosine biosynthesis protein TsaB